MGQKGLIKNILLITAVIVVVVLAATLAYLRNYSDDEENAPAKTASQVASEKIRANMENSQAIAGRPDATGKPVAGPGAKASKPGADDGKKSGEDAKAAELDELRAKIQQILSFRQAPTAEAVKILANYLNSQEDVALHRETLDTLAVIGANNEELKEQVLNVLLEKAQDSAYYLRGDALITAALVGDREALFPVIDQFIEDPGDDGKGFAVRAMAVMSLQGCYECVGYIEKILAETDDEQIQRNSAKILSDIGTPEALGLLEQELMSTKDDKQQATAAWALALKNETSSNQILIDAIENDALGNEALAAIAKSNAAADIYGELFKNENVSNDNLVFYLGQIGDYSTFAPKQVRTALVESIKPLLSSGNAQVEKAAIEALGKVGAGIDQSAALAPKLESTNFEIQQATLQAYKEFMTPSNYKPLIKLWYDDDEKIRRTAFFMSSIFVNTSDLPELEKAENHEDPFIRKQSAILVKNIVATQKSTSGTAN
jgi:HEAT repeat protein